MQFVHESLPQRVLFESGGAATGVASEVERLGARRVMVLAAPAEASIADQVTTGIPVVMRHDDVVMHVPTHVAEKAREAALAAEADALVCVGGGSTTGLAKAVALSTRLPIVAVPTTYAGSEATAVWGLTQGAVKKTGTDAVVLPRAVVYDATLTLSLSVEMSIASGLNALAHCIDSLWAPKADPINAAFAAEGVRALNTGLPQVADAPTGLAGREQTLYGAYLAAAAFASAGSGLHHKICHVLGGMYNLPHAQTHAVVLPQVVALNAPGDDDAERRLAASFASESALAGLMALRNQVKAPGALRDFGLKASQIADAVQAILPVVPTTNPTPVTSENLTALLRAAWEGSEPQ
ncbi:maleylacetate reductase [Nocardioides daejeonensis]|uniref:maleylacetate reductase n=1 Tax=Nocardioides daejeonensis TaxID=1046556 RepID=UPI000D74F8B2|nr:maleylacetate reductase [Nocardioides daejeonensis]